MADDPLAPLARLPGVAEASEAVRDALSRAHRHRANLRGWPANAAEAALRAARASAVLDGGQSWFDSALQGRADRSPQALAPAPTPDPARDASPDPARDASPDPVLAGALRVAEALRGTALVGVWQRAPLQALARLHMLAAADLVDSDGLGRPHSDDKVPRLELMAQLVAGDAAGSTAAPVAVLAAVAHGEILTLTPFGSADGVVARAVSRLITQANGLDPHGLGVPEVYWMRHAAEYRTAAAAFASGTTGGVAEWLLMCCRALRAGAHEALSIATSTAND